MYARTSQLAADRFAALEPAPAFFADWVNVLFVHFAVDREVLQREVPFELDLLAGRSFVSLVWFDARRVRPCFGGRLIAAACSRIAEHSFLNVRTYVRVQGEPGIYFLNEFVNSTLDALLGPIAYGLPYQRGDIQRDTPTHGCVRDQKGHSAHYYIDSHESRDARYDMPDTQSNFLLERYTAFTHWRGLRRRFRIWHEPWQTSQARLAIEDRGLLIRTGDWYRSATLCGAHLSRGVTDVWIGRPRFVTRKRGAS